MTAALSPASIAAGFAFTGATSDPAPACDPESEHFDLKVVV